MIKNPPKITTVLKRTSISTLTTSNTQNSNAEPQCQNKRNSDKYLPIITTENIPKSNESESNIFIKNAFFKVNFYTLLRKKKLIFFLILFNLKL